MELANPVYIWATVGLVLMLAEIIVPGGIVILLGASCLVISTFLALGLVEGFIASLTIWFITSIIFLLSFRHLTQKLVGGDAHVGNTDEELEIFNQLAEVKETIGPGQKLGRIFFQGTDWPALGDGSLILAGSTVRIICRENIALVVEPYTPKES